MTFIWKITLYYIGRTYVITRVLKWETGRQKSQTSKKTLKERLNQPLLILKMEGGYKSRNVGSP